MNYKIIKSYLTIAMLFAAAYAQVRIPDFEIHDRGNLWETMKDDGTIGPLHPTALSEFYPGMDWPGGPHQLISKNEQRSYLYGGGIWIGGKYSNGSVFLTEHGPSSHVNQGNGHSIIKTENFIESPGYDPAQAEQTITASWNTTANFNVRRVSRAWSFRGYNDFIIIEYSFTNNNSAAVEEVYFGIPYLLRPSYQDILAHNGWGDNITDRSDDVILYDAVNQLVYSYDSTAYYDWDIGNYWEEVEELRSPGFAGFALLGADPASDGSSQPANVLLTHYMEEQLNLTLDNSSAVAMYALLNGENQSIQIEPHTKVVPFGMISCGPYTIEPGESINISVVEAVNGIPLADTYGPPENMAAIQAKYLSEGYGLLQSTIRNAIQLYENNYLFDILPPASPLLEVIPNAQDQTIVLSWEPLESKWINPTYGTSNIKEYWIYRSDRSFIGPFGNPIKKVKPYRVSDHDRYFDIDIQRWVYPDYNISLGVGYYYSVTVLDSAGNESWLTNRNIYPVKSATLPAENALSVNVFPNPFRLVSGIPTGGEENTITFTNLPATCTIRIFTVSGELIKTFKRQDVSVGEEVWNQVTDSRQRTAPGIYFWTVDSEVGTAKGTLILIK
ncbi:MAG: hypothetical protein ABIA75_05390 [Candidatus Neomarinimicrobiota bacterium]